MRVKEYRIWTTNDSWYDEGWWCDLERWYVDHTNPDPFRLATEKNEYVSVFYRQNIAQLELLEDIK